MRDRPLVTGWNEYVDLPAWRIRGLRAKLDTGARSSALHVEDIEKLPGGSVSFYVVHDRPGSHRRIHVVTRILRRTRVRSSSGHYQKRIFVAAEIVLGPIQREIEVSLVDRTEMTYRMLLGRPALRGLLVDPQRSRLLGKSRRRRVSPRRGSG